jgi:hypothetical protein
MQTVTRITIDQLPKLFSAQVLEEKFTNFYLFSIYNFIFDLPEPPLNWKAFLRLLIVLNMTH